MELFVVIFFSVFNLTRLLSCGNIVSLQEILEAVNVDLDAITEVDKEPSCAHCASGHTERKLQHHGCLDYSGGAPPAWIYVGQVG